ncbi:MAG: hypothetical protein ABIH53_01885 [archaeon]
MKGLTETLMEEEAREHILYDKTANAYMFGAAMSNGFGSGYGSSIGGVSSNFGSSISGNKIGFQGSGLKLGSYGNLRHDLGYGLQERFDFSGHDGTVHVNYDLKGSDKKFSKEALKDEHKLTLWEKFLNSIY